MPLAGAPGPIRTGWRPPTWWTPNGPDTLLRGGELVPLVFEAGGRASDEAIAFLRSYGSRLDASDRSEVLSSLWRRLSRVLQFGTAEMVLSALA